VKNISHRQDDEAARKRRNGKREMFRHGGRSVGFGGEFNEFGRSSLELDFSAFLASWQLFPD